MDLGEVLRLDGRGAETIPYLEEAVALYEQKGCRVYAVRARVALADACEFHRNYARVTRCENKPIRQVSC